MLRPPSAGSAVTALMISKPEYASHWDKVGRKPKDVSDQPYDPVQAVGFVPLPDTDEEEFVYLANHYRLGGEQPESLCAWNREVSSSSEPLILTWDRSLRCAVVTTMREYGRCCR
jgi:hypothetical protein